MVAAMAPETPYERVVRFLREQPAHAVIPYRDDAVPPECPIASVQPDGAPASLVEAPGYAERALAAIAPYRRVAVDATVRDELLPALLG